jgi:hypothetical protein
VLDSRREYPLRSGVANGLYMKILLHVFSLFLIFLGATLIFERAAYAYADPGTGLLAVQAAGSALVATGWYLRRKIFALFHDDAPKSEPEQLPNGGAGKDSHCP